MADNRQSDNRQQSKTRLAGRPARFIYKPGGDLFRSQCQVLVNPVNCIGVSGALAGAFASKFPMMKHTYEAWCRWGYVHMGNPAMYFPTHRVVSDPVSDDSTNPPLVLLFPTMQNPGHPAHLSDIVRGLEHFARNYKEWRVTSVAFPALGCGVGGLLWSDVREAIRIVLRGCDVDVEMYGPEVGELPGSYAKTAKYAPEDRLGLFPMEDEQEDESEAEAA